MANFLLSPRAPSVGKIKNSKFFPTVDIPSAASIERKDAKGKAVTRRAA